MTSWDQIYLLLTLFLTALTIGTVSLFARLERRP